MKFKKPNWAHQTQALKMNEGADYFAFFFEQGTGKTPTLINTIRQVFESDTVTKPTLIVCPDIVVPQWKQEFLDFSWIPETEIHCLTGSQRNRLIDFQLMSDLRPFQVFICNYESLLMKDLFKAIQKWGPEIVVLDESQRIKDGTAKRTKRALELGEGAPYRYLLSGTPIVNSAFDIFTQFAFLDRGKTFSRSYREFRDQYFVDYNKNRPRHCYYPNWQLKPGSLEKINAKIYGSGRAMRVLKKDCLDLPPFIRQRAEYDLDSEQNKVYTTMEKDAVVTINDKVSSADLAIKQALRLQQICTGFVRTDEGKIHAFRPNPRMKVLSDVIDQVGDAKFIVWAVFKQNYLDIKEVLKDHHIKFGEIHGDISTEKKQSAIQAFNDDKSGIQALVAHPASGGVGVNLVAASYAIFYSRGFSLENDLQAEARNYRGGSECHEKITRIDIVARNTIDEAVLIALSDKKDISEAILQYVKGIKNANAKK